MPARRLIPFACAVLTLGLAACGGGKSVSAHPLGEEVAVQHTEIGATGSGAPKTTLASPCSQSARARSRN
jgi:hypothetical protein